MNNQTREKDSSPLSLISFSVKVILCVGLDVDLFVLYNVCNEISAPGFYIATVSVLEVRGYGTSLYITLASWNLYWY